MVFFGFFFSSSGLAIVCDLETVTSGFFFFSGSTLIVVAEIDPKSMFRSWADLTTEAKNDSDSTVFLIGRGEGSSLRDSDSLDFTIELLTEGTGDFVSTGWGVYKKIGIKHLKFNTS